MVPQQVVLVEGRIADIAFERLLGVRCVNPFVVLFQAIAFGE